MSTVIEGGFSHYTFNMKWFSRGNFESSSQAVVSYISLVHLRYRVFGWKLIDSLWIFVKISPNTDYLNFDQ